MITYQKMKGQNRQKSTSQTLPLLCQVNVATLVQFEMVAVSVTTG